jgi:hypothetical protein
MHAGGPVKRNFLWSEEFPRHLISGVRHAIMRFWSFIGTTLGLLISIGCSGDDTAHSDWSSGLGGFAGVGGAGGASGKAGSQGSGGSADAGSAGALCRFASCGGDPFGDWIIENACAGGVFGSCEARYPNLGPGGSLRFGCQGAFWGGFGTNVNCPQATCDCTVTRDSTAADASYSTSGNSLTLQGAGFSPVVVDYCVQGDVLTFGQLVSGSTPYGSVTAYMSFTARKNPTSPSRDACLVEGGSTEGSVDGAETDGDGRAREDGAEGGGLSCRLGPLDAGADARELDASDAAPLCRDFIGAPCNVDSDCASSSCFTGYPSPGGFCSKTCQTDADCGTNPFGQKNACVDLYLRGVLRCYPTCTSNDQCKLRYSAGLRCIGGGPGAAVCGDCIGVCP